MCEALTAELVVMLETRNLSPSVILITLSERSILVQKSAYGIIRNHGTQTYKAASDRQFYIGTVCGCW